MKILNGIGVKEWQCRERPLGLNNPFEIRQATSTEVDATNALNATKLNDSTTPKPLIHSARNSLPA